jgi:uncharacterized protein (DUF4415 family)
MRDACDFSDGKRGPVLSSQSGKTRITIRLDDDILEWFKARGQEAGGGNYQSEVNAALRGHIESKRESLESKLRRVIREELQDAG